MLPLAGFLITLFYQSIESPVAIITSSKWIYISAVIATFTIILSVLCGIFIAKRNYTFWYIPHVIFIWFITYIVSNFLINGVLQLLSNSTLFLWAIYIGVIISMIIHVTFTFIFGPKLII